MNCEDPLQELELAIDDLRREANGVLSIRLTRPDGGRLPPWEAGAHVDVVLPSGLVRQYSLCGSGTDPTSYTIAVLLEESGRGGSREVHQMAAVGGRIAVRGPRNHFRLEAASEYVFVAGGIGITPIRAMIETVEMAEIPWRLHYGGRSRAHMAFAEELQDRYGDRVSLAPQDTNGMLDLTSLIAKSAPDARVYACGPAPMLEALSEVCRDAEPARTLTIERFVAASTGASTGASAFDVELASSGEVLQVPTDRSILSVLRDKRPNLPYSCQEGVCGACEVRVLGGTPDHRDSVLTEDEREAGETMMICVSRCSTPRLVLDV